MSLIAISLTIQAKINNPLAKLILLLLADRHNSDTGECFPSLSRLTEDSGLGRATVIRKLEWLQTNGFITAHERRRPSGSRRSNAYTLHFVPDLTDQDLVADKGRASSKTPPERKLLTTPALPPEDWRPPEQDIDRLRTRYPHHDTSDDTIDWITREWISYCHANNRRYVNFIAAWRNSAERYLRRQSARPFAVGGRAGKRGGLGSVSQALRRSLGH